MVIAAISDGEPGGDVRAKLNSLITIANDNTIFSINETVPTLAAGADSNFELTLGNAGLLTSVVSDKPCWLTVYITASARTADSSRLISVDPLAGSGVIADLIFTAPTTINLTPSVNYWTSTDTFFRLKNTGAGTETISLDVNGIRLN